MYLSIYLSIPIHTLYPSTSFCISSLSPYILSITRHAMCLCVFLSYACCRQHCLCTLLYSANTVQLPQCSSDSASSSVVNIYFLKCCLYAWVLPRLDRESQEIRFPGQLFPYGAHLDFPLKAIPPSRHTTEQIVQYLNILKWVSREGFNQDPIKAGVRETLRPASHELELAPVPATDTLLCADAVAVIPGQASCRHSAGCVKGSRMARDLARWCARLEEFGFLNATETWTI
ncbi:unnamed protein product [Caretta caretta]